LRRLVLALAAAAAFVAAALFTHARATSAPPRRPPNVIVILIDTLRADHLGAYGYARPTSPRLDGFARRGVRFENARSQAPCTFPSVNSLLTSRDPAYFLGQPGGRFGIPKRFTTLQDVLRERGYRTMAVSASPIVRKSPHRLNPHGGFDGGFDVFDEQCLQRRAPCIARVTKELLAEPPEPFFLYLHYFDPHYAYEPPDEVRHTFTTPGRRRLPKGRDMEAVSKSYYQQGPRIELSEEDQRLVVGLYDEEILFMDRHIGLLLDWLEEQGLLRRSVVAVVADHGEEFFDHGHVFHCRTLYDAVLRTPMILSLPGARRGGVIDAPVENRDLMPTILDYLGIDATALALEGRSLRPLIEAGRPVRERAFAQQLGFRSITDRRHKLIVDLYTGEFTLFDLVADPAETRDVLRERRREFSALKQELWAHLDAVEGGAANRTTLRRAEESLAAMRALGYLN
jgi:arylsulfatase A-like enzyme